MSYLDLDFKSSHAPTQKTISRRRKLRPSRKLHINRIIRGFTALITLIGAVYLTLSFLPDSVARVEDSNLKPQRLHYSVLLPVIEETRDDHSILPENVKKQADSPWKSLKIKTGDTLASLFSSVGLDAGTTHQVANHNESGLSEVRKENESHLLFSV